MSKSKDSGRLDLAFNLAIGEASNERLRQYGNVSMPSVPIPRRKATETITNGVQVPVWIVEDGDMVFLVADLTEAIE